MSQAKAIANGPYISEGRGPRGPYDALDLGTPLVCPEETLTRQTEIDACDINFILARYARSGEPPVFIYGKEGASGDFSDIATFEQTQDLIAAASAYFDQLPAKTKERFNQNPAKLLDFLADEENNEEAIRLGLRPKPDTPAPADTPPATPPAPPPPGNNTPA